MITVRTIPFNEIVAGISVVTLLVVIVLTLLDRRRWKRITKLCVLDSIPDIQLFECEGWCSYFEGDVVMFPSKIGVDRDFLYFSIRPVWLTRVLAPSVTKPLKLPLRDLTYQQHVHFRKDVLQFTSEIHDFSIIVPLDVGQRIVARGLTAR